MRRGSTRVFPHPHGDPEFPTADRHPANHGLSRYLVGVITVILVVVLSGCAAPVAVPVPQPSESVCAESEALLPAAIRGQERRSTEPASDLTAAWGDPPVVWRCGVGEPPGLQPDSSLIEINGITWFAEELSAGYRFTTLDLLADVEVTVPDAYSPEAEVIVLLTPALAPLTTGG